MSWSDIKDFFYTVGAIAGVVALFRPVIESKFARDQARLAGILKLFDEASVVDLVGRIDGRRRVPDDLFTPFRALAYDREKRLEGARFTGPVSGHINREIDAIVKAYEELRGLIQVDEWEPESEKRDDGSEYTVWVFNKYASAFTGTSGVPRDYAQHLTDAASRADELRKAYQRLQIVGELHLLEVPLAGYLLRSRFRTHGLGDA